MAKQQLDLLALLADDKSIVAYRPRWNSFTGSVTATILLQQLIYRWVKNGRQPFYKFTSPCASRAYRPGDSWHEELGFSRTEFETARRMLAAKTHGNLDSGALVSYWMTADRKTWYAINETKIIALLKTIYRTNDEQPAIQNTLPLPDTAAAILDWMGFIGNLTKTDNNPSNALLLAWGWWLKLNQVDLSAKQKNGIALARSNWRKGNAPNSDLLYLAEIWLRWDNETKWDVLTHLDAVGRYGHSLTRGLEIPELDAGAWQLLLSLWKLDRGAQITPQMLMPDEPED